MILLGDSLIVLGFTADVGAFMGPTVPELAPSASGQRHPAICADTVRMSEQGNTESSRDGWVYLFFFALIVAVLTVPAVVLAGLLNRYVAGRLRRPERWALVLVAATWMLSAPLTRGREYIDWVLAVTGRGEAHVLLDFPLVSTIALAVLYCGVWVIVTASRISTRIPFEKPTFPWTRPEPEASTGVLPTETEREYSGSVVATGKALIPDPVATTSSATQRVGERQIPFAVDKYGQTVHVTEDELRQHVLLFGSTGSGKTEAMKTIMGALLDLGWHGTVLDLKEDTGAGGLTDWTRAYTDTHAIPYQELAVSSPEGRFWFNPLLGMGPDEARDTIVGAQQFDDGYYRSLNEKQLGQLIRLTYAAHQIDPTRYAKPSVYDLGKILAAPDLAVATKEMVATVISNTPGLRKEEFDSLIRPDEAMSKAAGGLGARLTAMYETDVARRTLRPGTDQLELDITAPGLTYIGLSSSGLPEISRLVSAAVLRRMAVYVSDRISGKYPNKHPHFLLIDEANFVNRRMLLELLSRARGAWIPTIVATQGPTDFHTHVPGEPGLESLAQNSNITIVLNQGEPTNAELCAGLLGKQETMKFSHVLREGELVDGIGSARSMVDYLVPPDELRRLGIGEAIIRVGKPTEWVRWLKFPRRDPLSRSGRN